MTGSGFGNGGQHTDYWEAWFAHTPGMKVVIASTPADSYGLMRSCIEDDDPCLFIENITTYGETGPQWTPDYRVPLGKARLVAEGSDVTIITYGRMRRESEAALTKLSDEGITADLLDLRSIAPWDKAAVLESVAKTGRALIVHEAVTEFGVGAEISSVINKELFGRLKGPVERMGAHKAPVPVSKPLELAHAPNAERIASKIREMVG
jgi:pyruvate dehydrogenase E1 component beta subunit